jgi:hypothetical protein
MLGIKKSHLTYLAWDLFLYNNKHMCKLILSMHFFDMKSANSFLKTNFSSE